MSEQKTADAQKLSAQQSETELAQAKISQLAADLTGKEELFASIQSEQQAAAAKLAELAASLAEVREEAYPAIMPLRADGLRLGRSRCLPTLGSRSLGLHNHGVGATRRRLRGGAALDSCYHDMSVKNRVSSSDRLCCLWGCRKLAIWTLREERSEATVRWLHFRE